MTLSKVRYLYIHTQETATATSKVPEEQEVITGEEQVHEFKTETKRLLDIVANSLYSEKEVIA